MKKYFAIGILCLGLSLFFSPIAAFAFVDAYPALVDSDGVVAGSFSMSTIEYEGDNDREFELERKIISIGGTKRVADKFHVYGKFGYIFDNEIDNDGMGDIDYDSGYFLAGGGSYEFFRNDSIRVHGYGQLDYLIEDTFESTITVRRLTHKIDYELNGYELTAGVIVQHPFNQQFSGFAGLEFTPLSEFEIDVDGDRVDDDSDSDLEREEMFGFRVGAIFEQDRFVGRVEGVFGSEQAFLFSAGMKF